MEIALHTENIQIEGKINNTDINFRLHTVRARKIGSAKKIMNFPQRSMDCLATDLHIKGKN